MARRQGGRASLPVWLALLTVYLVWGSTYLGIAVTVRSLPPFLMLAARFLVAGAVLLAWTWLRGGCGRWPSRREWRAAFLVGAALLCIGNGTVAWAEERGVATGTAALIIASVPLWLSLLDRLLYGRQLGAGTAAGIVIGLAGVALLVAPAGSSDWLAELSLLAGAGFWALGSLSSRRAPSPSPLAGAAMQMLAGGALLAVLAVVAGEAGELRLDALSSESLLGLLYLIVVGSLVGFSAYSWLLRAAPTSLVGTYAYVNPVVAMLLGSLLLGERLSWRVLVGGGVILAGVVSTVTRASAPPTAAALSARGR
jgi:drug/metabolite transporter (DMT)-like permease